MPRIPTLTQASEREYTRWVTPCTTGFLITCCDCGLVHDLQLAATKGGKALDRRTLNIHFRVRRNIKATKVERAQKKRRKK